MANNDPFNLILSQIADIIQLAREKSGETFNEGDLPADLGKRLDFLEDFVQKMNEAANEELEKKNISNRDLARKIIKERALLPKSDKQIVEKTLSLNQDALGLKLALNLAKLKLTAPNNKQFDAKKEAPDKSKKRKAKFKKAQGDSRWKKI
jgi:hypothetical protein